MIKYLHLSIDACVQVADFETNVDICYAFVICIFSQKDAVISVHPFLIERLLLDK